MSKLDRHTGFVCKSQTYVQSWTLSSRLENCTEMVKLCGYLTWELFEISCSDFQILYWGGRGVCLRHRLTKILWSRHKTDQHPHTGADIVLSVWRVQRYGADVHGCFGEALGAVRGSPKRGWLQLDVGMLSGARMSVPWLGTTLYL